MGDFLFVRARAPLRLGLAGGGTDVSPFCDLHGGFVLNATIDKYAYATIETATDGQIRFIAADQQLRWEGEALPQLQTDGLLDLHKGVYNRIVSRFNDGRPLPVTLTTFTDAPPGSGLGSSSTLVVAMLKAFVEMLNLPLGEYEIAHIAYQIERVDIGLQGGKQDQYAATFGGFNFMEFYARDRVVVNPLRIKNWIISELESSLVLYYTGQSRESAAIVDQQSRNIAEGRDEAIAAMQSLKGEAVTMKEGLLRGDFGAFIRSMEQSWESKKLTARNISNPDIDDAYQIARQAGAVAGKISGAGGGGFMMFFVDPARRMDVVRALQYLSGQVVTCHFTKYGTQGWHIR